MMLKLSQIRALIFDMDGVIYRGNTRLPGIPEFLSFLESHRINYICVTNNATRSAEQFSAKLADMKLQIPAEKILTSSEATASFISQHYPPGVKVLPVGEEGLISALESYGASIVSRHQDAELVVAGMDRQITYEKLTQATRAILSGKPFIGTNPDLTFPAADGINPGAGSILAAIEAASGVHPKVIGKPETTIFEMAMQRMDVDQSVTATLGDRLETDILCGQRVNITTILVMTGVTTSELLAADSIKPDYVFEDVPELLSQWEKEIL
ncbi:MAG: HAD-IIA family hydrolase [Chloroflexi bacterium]|nr:HAD-IIA family hydrolase [Chloroflexota bacterium]